MSLKDRLALLSKQGGAARAEAGARRGAPATAERLQRLLDQSARRETARRNSGWRCGDAARRQRDRQRSRPRRAILLSRSRSRSRAHRRLCSKRRSTSSTTGSRSSRGTCSSSTPRPPGSPAAPARCPSYSGLARPEPEGLRVRQYFLTGFQGEAAMLEHGAVLARSGGPPRHVQRQVLRRAAARDTLSADAARDAVAGEGSPRPAAPDPRRVCRLAGPTAGCRPRSSACLASRAKTTSADTSCPLCGPSSSASGARGTCPACWSTIAGIS